MAKSAREAYVWDSPDLKIARKVKVGRGPEKSYLSQSAYPAGSGISGAGRNMPEQSQIEAAALGSMSVVNQLNVTMNPDGTTGINVTVADATPETGPGVALRGTTAPLSGTGAIGVQIGWIQIGNGYKYYKEDGSGYKTGWHFENNVDGTKTWYYFDEDPNNKEWMVMGWKKIKRSDGIMCWYYFRNDGKMSIYWEVLDGWWYYLSPQNDDGYMITGWLEINGYWYYFRPDEDKGYMAIDWLEIRGKWYYFYKTDDKKGIMAANHMVNHTDGKKYYLGADGAMVTRSDMSRVTYNHVTYEVGEDGACISSSENLISIPDKYKTYYDNHAKLISQITTVNLNNKFDWDIKNIKKIYANNIEIYKAVSNETGVPPELIAAIHYRESGCKFDTYLHNGQKLGKPTTIVPIGKIFYDFNSAAVDALNSEQNSKGFHLAPDADLVTMMIFAEIYNGTGYTRYKGIPSPYVYSGTNVYISGKYVSDGKYDPNAIDKQPGVYLLVTTLQEM